MKLNKNIKNKRFTLENWNSLESFFYLKAKLEENFEKIVGYIEGCEFEIEVNPNGSINLIDLQGAYLGGVETYENFEDVFDACSRLESSFLYDYYRI